MRHFCSMKWNECSEFPRVAFISCERSWKKCAFRYFGESRSNQFHDGRFFKDVATVACMRSNSYLEHRVITAQGNKYHVMRTQWILLPWHFQGGKQVARIGLSIWSCYRLHLYVCLPSLCGLSLNATVARARTGLSSSANVSTQTCTRSITRTDSCMCCRLKNN